MHVPFLLEPPRLIESPSIVLWNRAGFAMTQPIFWPLLGRNWSTASCTVCSVVSKDLPKNGGVGMPGRGLRMGMEAAVQSVESGFALRGPARPHGAFRDPEQPTRVMTQDSRPGEINHRRNMFCATVAYRLGPPIACNPCRESWSQSQSPPRCCHRAARPAIYCSIAGLLFCAAYDKLSMKDCGTSSSR